MESLKPSNADENICMECGIRVCVRCACTPQTQWNENLWNCIIKLFHCALAFVGHSYMGSERWVHKLRERYSIISSRTVGMPNVAPFVDSSRDSSMRFEGDHLSFFCFLRLLDAIWTDLFFFFFVSRWLVNCSDDESYNVSDDMLLLELKIELTPFIWNLSIFGYERYEVGSRHLGQSTDNQLEFRFLINAKRQRFWCENGRFVRNKYEVHEHRRSNTYLVLFK